MTAPCKATPASIIAIVLCIVCAVQLCLRLHSDVNVLGSAWTHVGNYSNHDSEGQNMQTFRRVLVDGKAPLSNLDDAIYATQRLLSLIWNRYELFGRTGMQFFLTTNNLGKDTWDTIKYKFATKILQGDKTFLMIFGGSSVTAGHDNYFNQSYPLVVQHRLRPILEMLGVRLDVHNIAQGANNCLPYSFCYESMGGMDPDFVNWEQSYNCGHDDFIFELVARYSGWSKNRALIYYSASGAWAPDNCPPSKDSPPFSSERWSPASAGLEEWLPSWEDVKEQKELLSEYNKAKPSAARFTGWKDKSVLQSVSDDGILPTLSSALAALYRLAGLSDTLDYRGVHVHGFNVWEQNPKCMYKNKKGEESTNCNGIDAAQECTLRFMTREASTYAAGSGAKWHPTRAFHMLRGEMIAWVYGLPLLDALYMLQKDTLSSTREALEHKYRKKLHDLLPSMGASYRCNKVNCDLRPTCYTDFKPHHPRNMTLSELLVGSRTNWTYDDFQYGEWSLKYGYQDAKPVYLGKGVSAGEIQLRVTVGDTGTIWMCGNAGAHLHANMWVDLNAKIPLDPTHYSPPSDRKLWRHRRDRYSDMCQEIHNLPSGTHVISLKGNESHPLHVSSLTHVITWLPMR